MWRAPVLAFVAGIGLMSFSPLLPSTIAIAILVLVGLSLRRLAPWFGFMCLGVAWCGWVATDTLNDRWPQSRSGEVLWVTGEVVDVPRWSNDSLRFRFKTDDAQLPSLLEVRWYRARVHISPGQHWRLPLAIDAISGRLHFTGFDYERHLLVERVGAIVTVRPGHGPGRPEQVNGQASLMSLVHRHRQKRSEIIQANTTRLEVAGLKRALLTGDRGGLTAEIRDQLQATGTAHLLAISGLHVGMVASVGAALGWLLWPVLACLGLGWRRRAISIGSGLVFASLYAALAGFSLPTQRALVMLSIGALAMLSKRKIQPMDAWLVALFVVLLLDPLAMLGAGFWLSFAAVGLLIWAFAWRNQHARSKRVGGSLLQAQWVIMIGLMPVTGYFFGQWSPIAFVANLVAIPWVGLVVLPALLLGAVAEPIDWLSRGSYWVCDQGLVWLLSFLSWLQAQIYFPIELASGVLWWAVLGSVGAIWVLAPRGMPGRWLGFVLFGLMLVGTNRDSRSDQLRLTLFDVGSGLAVMVEHNEYRLVFDTGPGDGQGSDAIGALLRHFATTSVAGSGRWQIDDLVLSWSHQDHLGGIGSVAQSIWSKQVHHARSVELTDRVRAGRFSLCERGQSWTVGPWQFEFIHPGGHLPLLDGNGSCALMISNVTARILITSGLDNVGEAHLLQIYPELTADVWVVSRSGHREVASWSWLNQLQPAMALISVARNDRQQRPDSKLIERIEQSGARVLTTAQCGSIRLVWNDTESGVVVESAGAQRNRFWHQGRQC